MSQIRTRPFSGTSKGRAPARGAEPSGQSLTPPPLLRITLMDLLPPSTALQMAKGFKAAMITAAVIAVFAVLAGITISFYADLPAGATVVMVNFLLFALSFSVKKFVR